MKTKQPNDYLKELRLYGSLGLELVTHSLVGLGIGYCMDRWLGTEPWLMVTGLILGSAAGFMVIFRILMKDDEEDRQP